MTNAQAATLGPGLFVRAKGGGSRPGHEGRGEGGARGAAGLVAGRQRKGRTSRATGLETEGDETPGASEGLTCPAQGGASEEPSSSRERCSSDWRGSTMSP